MTATKTRLLVPCFFSMLALACSDAKEEVSTVKQAACSIDDPCCPDGCPVDPCEGIDCSSLSDQCGVGKCTVILNRARCIKSPLPDGTQCDDGSLCTTKDACKSGTCTGETAVTCTALDQCHAVGTCDPTTGKCSTPPKTDGTACNDGSKCTQTDTCQSGTCKGTNPVTCTASDQCHSVGTCDAATGTCSNPAKPNGTACNDGSKCTQTDTCQSGSCTGSNPVTCTASDQCHEVGSCDPTTGACSNPAKTDGASCNDGNKCTRTDTCQTGACKGSDTVTCTASDQCHAAGICDPATGACSSPAQRDGTPCNDENKCTRTDTCQAGTCKGSDTVTCAASDQCHTEGTCDPATGTCSNPAKENNVACDDGNACTRSDTCQSGKCAGADPVVCTAADACHDVGTCNPLSGACSDPVRPDGTPCGTSTGCMQTDTCQEGKCVVGPPISCPPPDQCHYAGTCDSSTGKCTYEAKSDGTPCSDGNACTQSDSCQQGKCVGSAPVACLAMDQCHEPGECDPATGACSNPIKPNTTACNDGNPCTRTDTCQSGKCVGVNPVTCPALDACHDDGTCDVRNGKCSYPVKTDGTLCNDHNACTQSDTCVDGTCTGSDPIACTSADDCHDVGTCDPSTGECSNPVKAESSPCEDGDPCTQADYCAEGACAPGVLVTCPPGDCFGEGACDPETGKCSRPPTNEGSTCDDGDSCTTGDTCQGGWCRGEGEPCVPDAAPPDSGLDASISHGDAGAGHDAASQDASQLDGRSGDGGSDEKGTNYYGCELGHRSTSNPSNSFGLALAAILLFRLRRRSRLDR
ncbi:MAG: hypothetical protein HY698_00595 [Deltaproteobacteria bacterium]|nr:hypothetical protein [Deltaproteobacteria bacterium]